MASIKLFLDTRRLKAGGLAPLKLAVSHQRVVRYVSLGLSLDPDPKGWDAAKGCVTAKGAGALRMNNLIARYRLAAENAMIELLSEQRPFEVDELRERVVAALFPEKKAKRKAESAPRDLLVRVMERFAGMKKESTRKTYERTIVHVKAFVPEWEKLRLGDVTRAWLMEFDAHMAKSAPSANARAIHMRNLRAVFNFAIDEELTSCYPFRRYKIKTVKTAKRSLSVEDLRRLLNADVEDWQRSYLDFFKLSFLLIGINPVDLLGLKPTSLVGDRIEYNRSKTSRLYNIKVEPEAASLIERMRGKAHLLRMMDERTDYLQYVRQANHALKLVGTRCAVGCKREGEAWFPDISMYWARHSWATIARSLGVSIDDIALALGHGDGHDLTHIYIDEELRKVDEANRRVIDWVLYGKKE